MNQVRFVGAMDPRRALRTKQNPYRRTSKRIDWLAVVLLLAAAMVALTMVYKFTTP